MELRDYAEFIVIDPAKLTAYALNLRHPKGKHKARVFQSVLGYTVANHEHLLHQVKQKAQDADAVLLRIDELGRHLRVDLFIMGLSGQTAMVRTGWFIANNSQTAHLTTLFVLREREK